MINKITPYVDFDYQLKSLDTISLELTYRNLTKVPKFFELSDSDAVVLPKPKKKDKLAY